MKEYNRQIVIFGDFKSIGFNISNQMLDCINKYDLELDAAPDYISNNGINGVIQINNINLMQQLPFVSQSMRPVLTTKDKNFSVFIGTTRIHVEENNSEIELYNNFIDKAKEIISEIISKNEDCFINRLALNGKIVLEDINEMTKIYSNTFKESELYGTESDEFSFRINTKINSNKVNSEINKIISYNRTNEILPNNETKPIIMIDYDYNTIRNENSRFNLEQLNYLIEEGIEFKSKII